MSVDSSKASTLSHPPTLTQTHTRSRRAASEPPPPPPPPLLLPLHASPSPSLLRTAVPFSLRASSCAHTSKAELRLKPRADWTQGADKEYGFYRDGASQSVGVSDESAGGQFQKSQQASGWHDAPVDRCGVRAVRGGDTSEYRPVYTLILSGEDRKRDFCPDMQIFKNPVETNSRSAA